MTKASKNAVWLTISVIAYIALWAWLIEGVVSFALVTGFYGSVVIYCFVFFNSDENKQNQMAHGPLNPQVQCQLCQNAGQVRVKTIQEKRGISGGKASAALLTGGLSVLATGLSRTGTAVECWCGNCKMKFYVR